MGSIISSKFVDDGKVRFELELDYEEAIQLKGAMKNIFVFSEAGPAVDTRISGRGKNEATKYFIIPREFRKGISFNKGVKCQKINTDKKSIFVYVVDKSFENTSNFG